MRLSNLCAYVGGILGGYAVASKNEWFWLASFIVMMIGGGREAFEERDR
jgi:hypothetical protein